MSDNIDLGLLCKAKAYHLIKNIKEFDDLKCNKLGNLIRAQVVKGVNYNLFDIVDYLKSTDINLSPQVINEAVEVIRIFIAEQLQLGNGEYSCEITSLRSLRKIVEDTKDLHEDTLIFTQVVGTKDNSGAWNMHGTIVKSNNFKSGFILNVSHPNLKRLSPDVVFDQS